MTSALIGALQRVAEDLDSLPSSWALVGGFAVSTRSEPRFTRDIDVCIVVADDVGAERVVAGLTRRGYRMHALVEQEVTHRLATVRSRTLPIWLRCVRC